MLVAVERQSTRSPGGADGGSGWEAERLVAGSDRRWRKNKAGPAEENGSPRLQLLEWLKGELLSWRSLVLLLSSRREGKLTVARWLLRLLLLLEASVTEEKSFAEDREMMQPPCLTFWWLLEVEMTVRKRRRFLLQRKKEEEKICRNWAKMQVFG